MEREEEEKAGGEMERGREEVQLDGYVVGEVDGPEEEVEREEELEQEEEEEEEEEREEEVVIQREGRVQKLMARRVVL